MEKPTDNLHKTNITLKMLIESQILLAGQEIFCSNPSVNGFLNSDGSITVFINGRNKVYDYLSGAARHIEGRSLNGWIYWYVLRDGEKVPLGNFRDQYLNRT